MYRSSLALLTDLYELTMAYSYWRQGLAESRAVFHLFFRENPFGGGYAIACGLASVIEFLREFRFRKDDLEYLSGLSGNDEKPLFAPDFLAYLSDLKFTCNVDAMVEGTVAFPHEPLVRVDGPLLQAQLVETALLNVINFQTLVATKAARMCSVASGDPVLEFGLRRAQGIDGGLAASRAAYVGGCAATSNVLAGKVYSIPVRGTHAHSWVMVFDDELESFEAYAEAMPNNCIFLVDTYDTIAGVHKAVKVGKKLREQGYEMVGIRLDSGDLARLSIGARNILDQEGFPEARIVASNDLDEYEIAELKRRGSPIAIWGVGTKLATAYEQPALGGVYKLAALWEDPGWKYKIKLSNEPIKVSNPGVHQVRRYQSAGQFHADMIYNLADDVSGARTLVPLDANASPLSFAEDSSFVELLQPVFRDGTAVYSPPPLAASRARTREQLGALPPDIIRVRGSGRYPVGLDQSLYDLKQQLLARRDD